MVLKFIFHTSFILNTRRKFLCILQKIDFSFFKVINTIIFTTNKFFFIFRYFLDNLTSTFEWLYKTNELYVAGDWTSFSHLHAMNPTSSILDSICSVLPGYYFFRFFQEDAWNWSFDIDLVGHKQVAWHQVGISFTLLHAEKYVKRRISLFDTPSNLHLMDAHQLSQKCIWYYPYKGIPYLPPNYFHFIRTNFPKSRYVLKIGFYHHEICLAFFVYLDHSFYFSPRIVEEKIKFRFSSAWVKNKDKNKNAVLSNYYYLRKIKFFLCHLILESCFLFF